MAMVTYSTEAETRFTWADQASESNRFFRRAVGKALNKYSVCLTMSTRIKMSQLLKMNMQNPRCSSIFCIAAVPHVHGLTNIGAGLRRAREDILTSAANRCALRHVQRHVQHYVKTGRLMTSSFKIGIYSIRHLLHQSSMHFNALFDAHLMMSAVAVKSEHKSESVAV